MTGLRDEITLRPTMRILFLIFVNSFFRCTTATNRRALNSSLIEKLGRLSLVLLRNALSDTAFEFALDNLSDIVRSKMVTGIAEDLYPTGGGRKRLGRFEAMEVDNFKSVDPPPVVILSYP